MDLSSAFSASDQSTPNQLTSLSTFHKTYWFHDGSIVLSIENTLFRVHQSILANHSEVFAGLFALPQPTGQTMVEGCHVVELHGDSVQDFEELLGAVYDPGYFDRLPPAAELDLPTLLPFVAGILRLSTKYLLRALRTRCIALLSTKLPCTYDTYLAKSAPTLPLSPTQLANPKQKQHEKLTSDILMAAISLLQATNVSLLLPYAFYCVARLAPKRLLKARAGDISWRDKTSALAGRENLRLAQISLSHSFLYAFTPAPTCQSRVFCANARGPLAEWRIVEAGKAPNPLRAYGRWEKMNVCGECVRWAAGEHERGRKEVWEALPGFFGLGTWEELRAVQER